MNIHALTALIVSCMIFVSEMCAGYTFELSVIITH